MSIRVTRFDEEQAETWDDYVERSSQATIFHTIGALTSQADHSNARLHLLVGYKGEEPVGIFPVFETRRGPLTFVFSPMGELHVPNLGPALINAENLRQRKQEKRHNRFIDGCLEWIGSSLSPHYISIRTSWKYTDLRPFIWNEFEAQPSYTYLLDIDTDESTLLDQFSSEARRKIRNNDDQEYDVIEGGTREIDWIVERISERYASQGKTQTMPSAFVRTLAERLTRGSLRPYVLTIDDDPVAGMICLEFGDTVHSWQGGATPGVDFPANTLLEWYMMTESMKRGKSKYEIVDANDQRINEWKTKFNPSIRTYYTVHRSVPGLRIAKSAYVKARDKTPVVAKLGPQS